MNELKEIADKLFNEYGSGCHWEITQATKSNDGKTWELTIRKIELNKGAENESDE